MKKNLALTLAVFASVALVTGYLLFTNTQSTRANPDILYVAPGGACGGSIGSCYASVQAAVDAATSGDEIQVAAGVYTDTSVRPRMDVTTTGMVTQVVYLTKTVSIRGGYSLDFATWDPAAYTTTLDAQGMGRGIYIAGPISPTIQGLRIAGGDASGLGGYFYYGSYDAGGGVLIITATATLVGNQISGNTAVVGGGVFLNNTPSRLVENRIAENVASNAGGGITSYMGAPSLDSNTVDANQSGNLGGGLYLFDTEPVLTHNQITGNTANNFGGGVDVASCSPTFNGNVFSNNTAAKGGGVYLWYSHSSFTNNVFLENHALTSGSGLYTGGSAVTLLNSTFSMNSGGDGSGLFLDTGGTTPSSVVISDTILVSHTVGISVTENSTTRVDGILWFNTPITVSVGTGPVCCILHEQTGDPAFASDGYHLTSGSAAIHAGEPAGVLVDIDGQPRSVAAPDLGADEFWLPGNPRELFLPMITK